MEAVRVRKELEELDEELQQHRSLASGISRFKDQDKAQDIVSSRVEMLEKQYKEKQSRYETLVAELAPNSWWPQPFDAEAQKAHLAAVTKRFSKIHAELAPLGLIPPPPTTDGMEVGDDVMRHDEGSKHPLPETSSGSEASISRGKDYASLRRTLDGLADRINDVEDTHAEKMKILEERTQMIADELRKPEFERNEDVVNYELLLKRVAASEAQARQLSTVAAELQAQTAAAVVNLQAARAENDELKNMLEEVGSSGSLLCVCSYLLPI